MYGMYGMFRVSFLKFIMIALCLVSQALAGHDVMVHLAIYNDGPFNAEKVPAVFGVPLPVSDDPVDPKDLILVGADAFQVRPLSHWPNGSVRWLMVEAMVDVQPSADRAAVHLTTGQRPRELPNIASEIPNGFILKTGKCTIKIKESESVLCTLESIENEEVPDFSIQLSNDDKNLGARKSRKVILENNGPVTATVAVIEQFELDGVPLEFSRRCQVFKDQHGVAINSSLRRLFSSNNSTEVFPDDSLVDLTRLKTKLDQSWRSESQTDNPQNLAHFTSVQGEIRIITSQTLNSEGSKIISKGNMLTRAWHEVDFVFNKNETSKLVPYIGVAVSNHTYNDSRNLEAFVLAHEGETSVDINATDISRELASKNLYDLLGGKILSKPSITAAMNLWVSRLIGSWNPVKDPVDFDGKTEYQFSASGLYSTWYFMTGDVVLRDICLNRASVIGPATVYHMHSPIFDIWDSFLFDSSIEKRNSVLSDLENRFRSLRDENYVSYAGQSFFRLIANVIHQGGLEETAVNQWLDRLESLVHAHRDKYPNDVLFAEGYRLTGEKEYLNQGRRWLKSVEPKYSDNNAITGMLENIQRQYTWRWLPVKAEDLGEQGWELSWTTPKNVVRYRFKQSDKPITNIPQSGNEMTTTSFCSADDLELDYSLSYPGSFHSFLISKSLTKGNRFFAIRYLERGPDLPAPAIKQTATSAVDSPGNAVQTPSHLRKYAWLGLALIAGGMVLIFKRKRT